LESLGWHGLCRNPIPPQSASTEYFAHEAAQNGHVRLNKMSNADQLAEVFTKALQDHQFENCVNGFLNSQALAKT
jgi:hypothetical protein